jgi:CHAT domain-containing protein
MFLASSTRSNGYPSFPYKPLVMKNLAILVLLVMASCKTPSMLVSIEQQKGDGFSNQYHHEQAVIHYKNALDASLQLGVYRNSDTEAALCRKLSYSWSVQGKYDEALTYAYMALATDSLSGNKLGVITDYRLLGKTCFYKGDYNRGIAMLEKALSLNSGMEESIKGLNQQSIADTYLSLAEANGVFGRFGLTETFAANAYRIYKSLNDPKGLMESWLVLGNANLAKGELNTALTRISLSKQIAEENQFSTSRHHQSLGEVYSALGEYEKALQAKLIALEKARETKIVGGIIWSTISAGDAYDAIGDHEKARTYYLEAMNLQSASGDGSQSLKASAGLRLGEIAGAREYFSTMKAGVSSGIAWLKMAEMEFITGNPDSAFNYFEESMRYFRETNVNEGMAKALTGKSRVLSQKMQYNEAISLLKESLGMAGQDETKWQIWYQLGLNYNLAGLPSEAEDSYRKAIDIIENIRGNFTIEEFKSKYIENKVKVYDEIIKLLIGQGKHEEAFDFSERARARAFLDMIGNKKISLKAGSDSTYLAKEQELRMQIQSITQNLQQYDLMESRGITEDQLQKELRSAREEYADLLQRLKLDNREYASMMVIQPESFRNIQQKMDAETAIVSYWVGKENMVVWLISKNQMRFFQVKKSSGEILDLVKYCRQIINRTTDLNIKPSDLAELDREVDPRFTMAVNQFRTAWDILLSQAAEFLHPYRNVCIIPHGPLHLLPFQACISPAGNYFVEDHTIFYAPSVSVYGKSLDERSYSAKDFMAVALGDLSLGDFSGLPGTTREVEEISRLFKDPMVRYEKQSTETFVVENAADYRILHFSTHGMMNSAQPLFSFVLLSPTETEDGFLTVSEVFGLDLSARLVTLSACETGLASISAGDDLVGMSRAFLYAGASSVVVSLWSVADQPTAYLMTRFYEYQKDHSLSEALTMAQREVMKKYHAPYYWAPFQLIGKGN